MKLVERLETETSRRGRPLRLFKREAKSIQDENKSLMTALKLLNNEIGKESKYRDGRYENIKENNLHDEETSWVTVRDNKTMPRKKKRKRQIRVKVKGKTLLNLPIRVFQTQRT